MACYWMNGSAVLTGARMCVQNASKHPRDWAFFYCFEGGGWGGADVFLELSFTTESEISQGTFYEISLTALTTWLAAFDMLAAIPAHAPHMHHCVTGKNNFCLFRRLQLLLPLMTKNEPASHYSVGCEPAHKSNNGTSGNDPKCL